MTGTTGMLTLPEFLDLGASRWPDRPWCTAVDGETTRGQLYADATACAAGLRVRGIVAGDRVVIVAPNSIEFLQAWLGVMIAGAIAVAVNPRAIESELDSVIESIRPSLLVIGSRIRVAPGIRHCRVADLVSADPGPLIPVEPNTHAGYIQSSGSTGRPKFIIQTHGMYTMAAEGFPYWLGLTEDDVLLTTLPLAHLNAQAYSALGSWGCGARLVLPPRFSPGTFWQTAAASGATVVNMIGAMLEILMERQPSPADHDHRLRLCYSAPAPTAARHRQIEERFGFRLLVGYAQSESPFGLISDVHRPPVYGTMGRPRQHPRLGNINEARLVDPVTGRESADGEVGELQLRNPVITPGYVDMGTESAELRVDGWLRTGDLARRDAEGLFTFAGRIKEMIRRRGENLSPAEVENVLDAHPKVVSSAVIGVPSQLSEEDVKAYIHISEGEQISAAEIAAWCEIRLPPYKRPRYLEFVDEWPLTNTNKIAKKQLSVERNNNEIDLSSVANRANDIAGAVRLDDH